MASARAANIGGGVAVLVANVVGVILVLDDDSGFGGGGSRIPDGDIGGSGCINCPKIDFPPWIP